MTPSLPQMAMSMVSHYIYFFHHNTPTTFTFDLLADNEEEDFHPTPNQLPKQEKKVTTMRNRQKLPQSNENPLTILKTPPATLVTPSVASKG